MAKLLSLPDEILLHIFSFGMEFKKHHKNHTIFACTLQSLHSTFSKKEFSQYFNEFWWKVFKYLSFGFDSHLNSDDENNFGVNHELIKLHDQLTKFGMKRAICIFLRMLKNKRNEWELKREKKNSYHDFNMNDLNIVLLGECKC